ncbi:DUF7350 domain-containing protein [Natronomonas marina]|jgi:hypothetical protein|uniref:DUF7350 domain-containing protein n=1 Tax=Natronomonas marina TaxID=2961939 RepID=UPI0020C95577|nr:hypothetical protein [Natronomonas marina]
MKRRDYLHATLAVGAVGGVAGCTDLIETREVRSEPAIVEDRPAAVYHPTHVDGMKMVGTTETDDGEYAVGLTYTYPHRFWRVDGSTESVEEATLEPSEEGDDVHLMSLVWDPETGRTLPESGVSVGISKGGDPLDEQVIYPMLSPRMGFHYGANFELDGDGDYEVTVDIGGTSVRRTGAYQGRFGEAATATVPFEYSADARSEISVDRTPEKAGEPAVPSVMGMMDVPLGVAPDPGSMPGQHRGTAESGDARLAVVTLESPPEGVDGEGAYLAVSARTPYNQLLLPMMQLEATLARGGETVFDGRLTRTFDDRLNYHYGAAVDPVESGDELTVRVRTDPQVARHEGYETAFLDMPEATMTL